MFHSTENVHTSRHREQPNYVSSIHPATTRMGATTPPLYQRNHGHRGHNSDIYIRQRPVPSYGRRYSDGNR
eukprot:3062534-Ditylum_brightwellii.AAC.1